MKGLYSGPLFLKATLLFVLAGLAQRVWSKAWRPNDLPSPQNDPFGICRRNSMKSVVCDPDGYLSKDDADTIDGLANFIYEGKSGFTRVHCADGTGGGAQLGLAIVERMNVVTSDQTKAAYGFAQKLHDKWGVGDPKCENGIVLFFSIADRVMGVSIGRGIKHFFPGEYVETVMVSIRDQMRMKQYGPALIQVVNKVGKSLSNDPPHEPSGLTGLFVFFFITTAIIIISSICNLRDRRRSRERYNRCRHVLERLDEDCDRVVSDTFVVKTCPICLEDFPDTTSAGANNSAVHAGGEDSATSTTGSEEITVPTDRGVSSTVESSLDAHRRLNTDQTNLRFRSRNQAKINSGPGASETHQSEVRALTLRCGHKFHLDCINKWIGGPNRANATCPICRRTIDDDERQGPLVDHSSDTREYGDDRHDFNNEYRFRIQRARFYFPDFITAQMVAEWMNHGSFRFGAPSRLATSPMFRAANPIVMARSAGRSGSSFSFGGSSGRGGSSRGGGGGGARW